MDNYIPVIKIDTYSDKVIDELSKLSFCHYHGKSRIDGCPLFNIDMDLLYRYIKLKKIRKENTDLYDEILENMKIVSVLEDYLPTYIKIN